MSTVISSWTIFVERCWRRRKRSWPSWCVPTLPSSHNILSVLAVLQAVANSVISRSQAREKATATQQLREAYQEVRQRRSSDQSAEEVLQHEVKLLDQFAS